MRKIYLIIIMLFTLTIAAQENFSTIETELETVDSTSVLKIKKNALKFNLTGLVFNNYSFQYERILSKRISFAVSYRFMPQSKIPFKSYFEDDDEDSNEPGGTNYILNNTKIGNMAITPEFRFYLGKGYGKGFYIAPYYRYAKFTTDGFTFEYDTEDGGVNDFKLSGNVTSHSFGLYFGAQFTLGKHMYLDWWIFGGHYGSSKGELTGRSNTPLSDFEQQSIREELEDLDLPLVDTEVEVNSNSVKLKFDGPWAGLRAGLSIGFRF